MFVVLHCSAGFLVHCSMFNIHVEIACYNNNFTLCAQNISLNNEIHYRNETWVLL